jgi:hypothetical protein
MKNNFNSHADFPWHDRVALKENVYAAMGVVHLVCGSMGSSESMAASETRNPDVKERGLRRVSTKRE